MTGARHQKTSTAPRQHLFRSVHFQKGSACFSFEVSRSTGGGGLLDACTAAVITGVAPLVQTITFVCWLAELYVTFKGMI